MGAWGRVSAVGVVAAAALVCALVAVVADSNREEEDRVRATPATRPDHRTPTSGSPTATGEPTATEQPPTAPPPRGGRTATVVLGGDLLWHDTVWASAAEDHARTGKGRRFDFAPMLADLEPLVQGADLALCHEEVPFAAPGGPLSNYPVFAAPPEVAAWIATMGYDACTTASNHALDQGYDGLARTDDLLEAAGVAPVGTFRSLAERRIPVVLTTAGGVRVGLVAGTYGLNGFPLPEGRTWSVSLWDAPNLLYQAHAAREAGADIVVVHLHGGTEYDHLPNADQVALVDRLTRSPDVDLVVGDHAHVVQPITRVHGTWVVYGMGNLVAQQEVTRPDTYRGILADFRFTEQPGGGFEVTRASYVPVGWNHYVPGSPIRVVRLDRPGADPAARAAIAAAVDGLGRTPGLREG